MASLSGQAPELKLDAEELKQWGYIWRVGTKVRKRSGGADDAGASEEESVADDEAYLTDPVVALGDTGDENTGREPDEPPAGEISAIAPSSVKQLVRPLTANEAGVPAEVLRRFDPAAKYPSAFNKKQGIDFGLTFDRAVGKAFAEMLGNGPHEEFKGGKRAMRLLPKKPDCVEVGPVRVIGGVRPQNFDVGYRPDGVRIAYDSKTLNDAASIQKNWQNMINDLATEATTVHTRFPYAVVAFLVAVPRPALRATQQADLVRTLERLALRRQVIDQAHLAEAIALVVWDPETGAIDSSAPDADSVLRHEMFMSRIYTCYVERYKGLPPHDK